MEDKNNGIGLLTSITIIVGGMIGSAIFSLSGLTMYMAGPSAVLSWLIAAVIMLIYGLVIAELATLFPKSGGVFIFPLKAFGEDSAKGRIISWISCWGYINGNIAAVAFAAIYVGTYLSAGFGLDSSIQVPLAIVSTLICMVLNLVNFKTTGKLNTVLVSGLLIALGIYVVAAFSSSSWDASLFVPFFLQGSEGKFGFAQAVPTAMLGYGSIVSIAYLVGEVKNPKRDVPVSVVIGMIIVLSIYSLVIISTLGLVSASFMSENPGMRYIPLYAACFTKLANLPWLSKVVSVAAVLALLTTMLVVIALTSRAVQVSSQRGLLPAFMAKENNNGVPANAAVVLSVICALVSAFPGFTETIVNLGALFGSVTNIVQIVVLIYVRKNLEYPQNVFKAPGGKVLPFVGLFLILACYIPSFFSSSALVWLYTIVWYAIGMFIYWISRKLHKA